MTQPDTQPRQSDLGVRVASAIVMVAVAGMALWLGGWVWTVFVIAVALGVLWEWWGLVSEFATSPLKRGMWNAGGALYVGTGAMVLLLLRDRDQGAALVLATIVTVIAVDVGAYFVGRAIGGPKIAPKVSPSKTWAGLAGGATSAGIVLTLGATIAGNPAAVAIFPVYLLAGCLVAIVAQVGDFFESWMKRRAGVKDSGKLIPGHGGLFDRVDGLLAVLFVIGLLSLHSLFISE